MTRRLLIFLNSCALACFVKQLGARPLKYSSGYSITDDEPIGYPLRLKDRKGGDISEFPIDLQIREFPNV